MNSNWLLGIGLALLAIACALPSEGFPQDRDRNARICFTSLIYDSETGEMKFCTVCWVGGIQVTFCNED